MRKSFSRFILHLFGWNIESHISPEHKKMVVMMAPHTSNWDFVIGWLGFNALGLRSRFLIKKEFFKPVIGGIIKAMGAIPVNRKSPTAVVQQVAELFNSHEEYIVTITPEGTRSLNRNWKRGFYHIARQAGVPIGIGYLDYKKKEGGILAVFFPTGDYEADFKHIEKYYYDKNAKFPEKFNLSPQNRKV